MGSEERLPSTAQIRKPRYRRIIADASVDVM